MVTAVDFSQSLQGKHSHLVIIYALAAQHASIQGIKQLNSESIIGFEFAY